MVRVRTCRRFGIVPGHNPVYPLRDGGVVRMVLVWLILIPLLAGILAWIAARTSDRAPRWVCLLAMAADLAIAFSFWLTHPFQTAPSGVAQWSQEVNWEWIPQFGIRFHLALDGLSLTLLLLTFFLGVMSVLTS